jgi:hypothetical protein
VIALVVTLRPGMPQAHAHVHSIRTSTITGSNLKLSVLLQAFKVQNALNNWIAHLDLKSVGTRGTS